MEEIILKGDHPMTEPHRCPQCNVALIENAPSGLCPNCLLKLALDSAVDTLGLSLSHTNPLLSSDTLSLPAGYGTIHFNDYELVQEIARGGMGVVFRARQISLNRTVAVKMMRPGLLATEEEIRRFHAEAEAAAKLKHTNIVAIHEVGEQDGLHFFSMDYIEGQSLAELAAEHTLEATRAARYLKTIAEAVHYAHEQGILHRDLKPSNILIDKLDRPHVTDFGLAKRIGGDSGMTATGAILGTPSYMPPEQAEGRSEGLSPATDVYSLGAILYEMLTGRPPHQAATPVETIMLVLKQEPAAPRLLNPKIDRDLETICLKSLEKSAAKRYATAKEMGEDLGRYLNREPIKARRINTAARALRWCRRNAWVTAAAVAIFMFAITATFSAINFRRSKIKLQQSEVKLQERLWLSLIDQARTERFAGDRGKSLEKIAEAARIKYGAELRQEAIQTITTPGARLLHQFPLAGVDAADNLAFSPDSKILAASDYLQGPRPHRLKVWELYSGRPLAETGADGFAFTPNSSLLAVHRSKKLTETVTESLFLWDPYTGQDTVNIFSESRINGLYGYSRPWIFSPDGAYLALGSTLYNLRNPSVRAVDLEGTSKAFVSNDKLLLDSGGDYERYDATTGEYCTCVRVPNGMDYMSASEDGRIAVLHPKDRKASTYSLIVWDVSAQKEIGSIPIVRPTKSQLELSFGRDYQLKLSADGKLIALHQSSFPTLVEIRETTAPGLNTRYISLGSSIKIPFRGYYDFDQASFSPDGNLFAAGGNEFGKSSICIWDTRTGNQVTVLHDNGRPVWSKDSKMLATIGKGNNGSNVLNVWLVTSPTSTYFLSENVKSLSFNANGNSLLSNGMLWEVTKNNDQFQLRQSSQSPEWSNTFFDKAGRAWTKKFDQDTVTLRQFYPENQEILLKNPGYSDLNPKFEYLNRTGFNVDFSTLLLSAKPQFIDFSPNGRHLVMINNLEKFFKDQKGAEYHHSEAHQTLELWDLVDQRRLAIWNRDNLKGNYFNFLLYSPDGNRILFDGSRNAEIWDAASGKKLFQVKQQYTSIQDLRFFSPDSKRIFFVGIGNSRCFITVNDAETGRELRSWEAHKGKMLALEISKDGNLLASVGDDRIIRLWDAATGRELARWEGHQSEVTALALSPDGQTLASGGADGTIRLWNIPFIRRELSSLGLDW
jgi:WD40 repeat protein/predicted Ser/Thr protein kinase